MISELQMEHGNDTSANGLLYRLLENLVFTKGRYPTLERNCDFRDATNHPAWSCYVTEDAGESLSLRLVISANVVSGHFFRDFFLKKTS